MRRLIPEKQSLTIFCDELDHQIDLYDSNMLENMDALEDCLDNLQGLLNKNTDEGPNQKNCLTRSNNQWHMTSRLF